MKEIELSSVITDIAAGPFGSNLKVSCFVPYGFPIIDGANLKGFTVTDNVTKFVTEEKARSLSRSIAKRGDVVVTISGTLGQAAYIPENSEYEEYLCSQRQFRVTFDSEKVYVPYIVFYLHSREGQSKIMAFANQTGVPALSQPLKNFKKIKMYLPSIDVQRKVAGLIERINDKIATNNAINRNLQEQVYALYVKLFKTNSDNVQRVCKAEDYFSISIGKTPPRKESQWFTTDAGNVVWVSISDMKNNGVYISDSSEYLNPEAIQKYNIVVVPDNTVLLSFKLTVGRIAISCGRMATNEAIAHFKALDKSINPYLYCFLTSFDFDTLGSTSSIATAVNSKMIKNMLFPVPKKDALHTFNNLAIPAFSTIKERQNENHTLSALRDTLLPRLMSGEIDVSNIEVE